MSDKVSVIIPVFDAENTLSNAIESVLKQTYSNFEIILIDDGSTDNSAEIISQFLSVNPQIISLKTKGRTGAGAARNLGIAQAGGRYIAFLDSDDLWLPTKLEKQIKQLESTTDAVISVTQYQVFKDDLVYEPVIEVCDKVNYEDLLRYNSLGNLTVVIDSWKLTEPLKLSEIKKRQDWASWLQILKKTGMYAYGIKEVLALYRLSATSLSADKKSVLKYNWKVLRSLEKQGIFKSTYCFLCYALYNLKKKWKFASVKKTKPLSNFL